MTDFAASPCRAASARAASRIRCPPSRNCCRMSAPSGAASMALVSDRVVHDVHDDELRVTGLRHPDCLPQPSAGSAASVHRDKNLCVRAHSCAPSACRLSPSRDAHVGWCKTRGLHVPCSTAKRAAGLAPEHAASPQVSAECLINSSTCERITMATMKAAVFVERGRIVLDEKPIPAVGPLDALVRITTTTICGTDVHIMKGEYPVRRGLTVGHEPVGVIEKLGSAVTGYREGQRVIAGAITPSGYSHASLCGYHAQDGAGTAHGWKALGGWKFGNTVDGCQAEYALVPDAMATLSPVPDGLSDEEVLMCPDIMSTGFAGAESGGIRIGDTVAVFAQGPIGLCATF